jgi:D-alanyl-D-alanine dipeptidase
MSNLENNLVEITAEKFGVILDLRYASANNVCHQKLYSQPLCYLHSEAAKCLKKATESAKILGYKIKIFDGFRPIEVQKFMFNKFPGDFVSDPATGSTPHCRGVAIDLTLTDLNGTELEMGSDFDEFSETAFHNCTKISVTAQKNRLILLGLMSAAGFDFYSKEWWHYQLFKPREYPIIPAPQGMVAV